MRIAVFSTARVPSRTANSIQVMKVCQALLDLGHSVRLWLPGAAPGETWPELATRYGVRRPDRYRLVRRCPMAAPLRLRPAFLPPGPGAGERICVYAWPLQTAALASTLGAADRSRTARAARRADSARACCAPSCEGAGRADCCPSRPRCAIRSAANYPLPASPRLRPRGPDGRRPRSLPGSAGATRRRAAALAGRRR